MAYTVKINNYPDCCGMYILSCFFRNPTKDQLMDPKKCCPLVKNLSCQCPKTYEKGLKELETEEEYRKRIRTSLEKFVKDYTKQKAYLLATLNESEDKVIGDIMIDTGFTVLLPMTKNPTGTKIVTYSYDLCKEPEKKVKV